MPEGSRPSRRGERQNPVGSFYTLRNLSGYTWITTVKPSTCDPQFPREWASPANRPGNDAARPDAARRRSQAAGRGATFARATRRYVPDRGGARQAADFVCPTPRPVAPPLLCLDNRAGGSSREIRRKRLGVHPPQSGTRREALTKAKLAPNTPACCLAPPPCIGPGCGVAWPIRRRGPLPGELWIAEKKERRGKPRIA